MPIKRMMRMITNKKGFTLIELMVAVSVFIVVMTISSGSIVSVFGANQKSKTLRSVMDNLNLTLESMTRTIRFGTNYHCGPAIPFFPLTSPLNCPSPGFNSALTLRSVSGQQVTYALSGGRITRTIGAETIFITSLDVVITKLDFRVYGSQPYVTPDLLQPQVIVVISGYVGAKPTTQSSFSLETTVSQRVFDFQ